MISVSNVYKSYKNKKVLKNINLEFPNFGIVAILGASGSGKTTLLNCISGLIEYSGSISINNKCLENMSEDEKSDFRLRNFGFIFQDFKLFENESIKDNILFPLETISNTTNEIKLHKVRDLTSIVGIAAKIKEPVDKLSGGQKQRVAIARALINDPKVIFADEPTGALDEENSINVMNILKSISSKVLVILVTHDEELANKYADGIVYIKDGEIVQTKFCNSTIRNDVVPVAKNVISNKRSSVSPRFIFHHIYSSLKRKKYRTLISNLVTSLGLVGVGVAINLSSAISQNIKDTYAEMMDQGEVVVSVKNNDQSIYGKYAGNYVEAVELKEKYKDYIKDVGVNYICNYENFFVNSNYLALQGDGQINFIDGYSVRNINDFLWLDVERPTVYPSCPETLEDDEIVISLNGKIVDNICYSLRIERSVPSLSNYLQHNNLYVYFNMENLSWEYSDQQILKVKGFTLDNNAHIYHYNHLWNEYMLEDRMRFPTNDNLDKVDHYPWVMKKIYYLCVNNSLDEFLKISLYDSAFDPWILEIADSSYYPVLFNDKSDIIETRLLIFSNLIKHIPINTYKYLKQYDDNISKPIYGSAGGYSIYPSMMMSGFANFMYFSADYNKLENLIDNYGFIEDESNNKTILPDGVISGHYSQTISGGVNFKILCNELSRGKYPNNYDEIVISQGMANQLFKNIDPINKDLNIAYIKEEKFLPDNSIEKLFSKWQARIVGVTDEIKPCIYHDEQWPIIFFQTRLGVSSFNLTINTISLSLENGVDGEQVVSNLSKYFPEFYISNPSSEINKSIDKVCNYVEIALLAFSSIAILTSILLLTVSNYLYVLENKKDIGLVRCLGIKKRESRKFVIANSLFMSMISLVVSGFELLFITALISYLISQELGRPMQFIFNPTSILLMFVISILISLFSSILISNKVSRLEPVEALKK